MCICSYACVHKCEYVNVETLNTALVKCMIRKHKPMPPLPALSLHPSQRHFQGASRSEDSLPCDYSGPFFLIMNSGSQGSYLLSMPSHVLFIPQENSLCTPCDPQELSIMMSCCPTLTSSPEDALDHQVTQCGQSPSFPSQKLVCGWARHSNEVHLCEP